MLSRLTRYGGAAAASIISNNMFRRCFLSSSGFSNWHNRLNLDNVVVKPHYIPPGAIKDAFSAQYWFRYMLSTRIISIPDLNAILTFLDRLGDYQTVISLVEQWESESDQTYAFPDIDTWKIHERRSSS
ncbi:hypothetical protein A2U01_0009100 [Trifolium medium]|uniref:Uncharacterized protein n=1 Tax=Trifolium medium TaxID=97028 RepID=A0A392ML50_9FABA|nr:hypothetical protein [Trifolium medium]